MNGHGNKLQLDLSFIESKENDDLFRGFYPGYQRYGSDNSAILLRFQWQLAL